MKVVWVRGFENIDFNSAKTFFCLGVRGSGKSSLLEHIGKGYLEQGHCVLDLFSSRDGESLGWLRSPYAKNKHFLLLCGDNVEVEAPCEVKHASKLKLQDLDDFDIVISTSPLYSSVSNEFKSVNSIVNRLYRRLHYKRLVYMLVRESANLYYSRLRVSHNQLGAKAETAYLVREARHMGLSLGLDTLKWTSVDIDLRVLTDYLLLKSQGALGLPDQLQWLYSFFNPSTFRKMPDSCFYMLTRDGSLGIGEFNYHDWHKVERENILEQVGVKVRYDEELKYAKDKGTHMTVGDTEHVKIINTYIDSGKGTGKVGEMLHRSSGTISRHIRKHDLEFNETGFCPQCKRAKGKYMNTEIRRRVKLIA